MAPPATRTYDHFCMLARTLEQVGDRWTLLVVRDLLVEPRRFTDLMGLLGGITPKTLSQRLKELEHAGIVDVDRKPGRREVWYRLTPAGEDLAPAVEALFAWGLRHARRPPAPDEQVHPEHLLNALRRVLSRTRAPDRPLLWHFAFADGRTYGIAFNDGAWTLSTRVDDSIEPDVAVRTTTDAWRRYVTAPPSERARDPSGVELVGSARELKRFRQLIARFPDGA